LPELLVLGAIEQSSREVNVEVIAVEALGDWIHKKRAEHAHKPHPEDWDWEKP
jgi:16S rRNA U1498 N3-methylase RsmE